MFSPGFILHSTNNYGVVKTETIFGFGPQNNFDQNLASSKPLQIFGEESFGRSFKDPITSQKRLEESRNRNNNIKLMQRKNDKKHSKHKVKKCIFKLLKGKKKKYKFLKKKFLLPLLIGIVAAKTLLIPLALKALALVSLKGLLIGFFSATMLSLRGILSHSYGYHHRSYDGDKQLENIYIPSKQKVSYEEFYQRNDRWNSKNKHKQR